MALPLLLALMAASAAANAAGQKKVNNERGKALQAEIVQRSKLQQDSEQKARASADALTGIATKQKALAAARAPPVATTPNQPAPPGAATQSLLDIFSPSGSSATVQEAKRQGAVLDARQGGIARSQMGLDDYGNLMTEAGKTVARNAQDVGQNITSAQNYTENVLKPKLVAADASGRNWNTLGDVLQLAASLYAPSALGGGKVGTLKKAYDASTGLTGVGTGIGGGVGGTQSLFGLA